MITINNQSELDMEVKLLENIFDSRDRIKYFLGMYRRDIAGRIYNCIFKKEDKRQ